jgi:hypothetical protein
MSRISTHAISFCLIGSGVLAWAFAGRPLATHPDLDVPLNPLGINGSPYGEVFAMAMQGSIETYFHGGMGVGTHRHEDSQSCDSCQKTAEKTPTAKPSDSLDRRFENFLASLSKISEVSTNPKAPSDAHKRYPPRSATPLRVSPDVSPFPISTGPSTSVTSATAPTAATT